MISQAVGSNQALRNIQLSLTGGGALDALSDLNEVHESAIRPALFLLLKHYVKSGRPDLAQRCYDLLPPNLENQALICFAKESQGLPCPEGVDVLNESNVKRGLRGLTPYSRIFAQYYLGKISLLRGENEAADAFFRDLLAGISSLFKDPKEVKIKLEDIVEILLDNDLHRDRQQKAECLQLAEDGLCLAAEQFRALTAQCQKSPQARTGLYYSQCQYPSTLEPLLGCMAIAEKRGHVTISNKAHELIDDGINNIASLERSRQFYSIYIHIGARFAQMGRKDLATSIVTTLQRLPDNASPYLVKLGLPYLFYCAGEYPTALSEASKVDRQIVAIDADAQVLSKKIGDLAFSSLILGGNWLGTAWSRISGLIGSGKLDSTISEKEAFFNASRALGMCAPILQDHSRWSNLSRYFNNYLLNLNQQIREGMNAYPHNSLSELASNAFAIRYNKATIGYAEQLILIQTAARSFGQIGGHADFRTFFAECEVLVETGYFPVEVIEKVCIAYAQGICEPMDIYQFDEGGPKGYSRSPSRTHTAWSWGF